MPAFGGISAAIALGGLAYSVANSEKQKKKAQSQLSEEQRQQAALQTPQSVNEQLNDARAHSGSVNPALLGAYQQALQSQQNASSFAQRNASSGAQALSAASQAQNQTQSIIPQLSQMQTGYDMQNRSALVDALKTSADADYRKQADAQERNQAAQQFALGQIGAANANKSQAIGAGIATLGSVLNYMGQVQQQTKPFTPSAGFMANTNGNGTPLTSLTQQVSNPATGTFNPNMQPMSIADVAMRKPLFSQGMYYNPYRFAY